MNSALMLFYAGVFLLACATVMTIIWIVAYKLKKRKLDAVLDKEYGKKE